MIIIRNDKSDPTDNVYNAINKNNQLFLLYRLCKKGNRTLECSEAFFI